MSEVILVEAFGRYYTKKSLTDLKQVLSSALGRCSLSEPEYEIGDDMFKSVDKILKEAE